MNFRRLIFILFFLSSIACVETVEIDETGNTEEELISGEKDDKLINGDPCRINMQEIDQYYSLEGEWSFLSFKKLGSETYMDNWTCVAQIAHYAYHDENLPLILDLRDKESGSGDACTENKSFGISLFLSELTSCYQVSNDEEIEFVFDPEDAVYRQNYCFMSQCGYDKNFYENLLIVNRYEIRGNQLRLFPKDKDYSLWFVAVDREED